MHNKITLFLLGLIFCLPCMLRAQDIAPLLKEAQQLEAALKDEAALDKYLQVLKVQPAHLTSLCKASELYSITGEKQTTSQKQNEYYRNAKAYAQKALQANANSSEANAMMSIAMGRMALIASGKEKINAVRDIKSYAEKAIQFDASNYKAYHVLGKWHHEVSELSGAAKWLVKVTFGALPKATLDDALANYEKSKKLHPAFLRNYLEMARVYEIKDEDKKAIELLEAMLKLPNTTSNDDSLKKEAREFLDDLK